MMKFMSRSRRKRLIIHLGMHKTGSTFLQTSLRKRAKQDGEFYALKEDLELTNASSVLEGSRRLVRAIKEGESTSNIFDDLRNSLISRQSNIILSNENTLGDQLGQAGIGELYPFARQVVNFLDRLNGDFELEYVFYVRNQVGFIESSYLNLVRDGLPASFDEYLHRISFASLDYDAFFDGIASVTSAQIHVIPFELLKFSLSDFFSSFTEIVDPDLTIEPSNDQRPSFSSIAMEIARKTYPLLSGEDRVRMGDFLAATFSQRTHPKPKLFPPIIKQLLSGHFRPSNDRLFERWIKPHHRKAMEFWRVDEPAESAAQ